MHIITAYAVAI